MQSWNQLHKQYKDTDWIDKPNIFATEIIQYLPRLGKLLDLGAGQGQDTKARLKGNFRLLCK